ncbi:DUF2790 domain-containing protein [Pseudomonas sp. LTJR-52]|uniref:DUF2790 domain-containing protein n=1 Tax=Pseudomonas sp. LTJR-52 TaxID=2479392 RepID=UPI000EFDAC24|nr:DUF2790 domain-containing protein [Pseudomonas sp. LTJR-52]AYN97075.1 DUF2790 domain-containing protein [Pseudomonas sp. LTJR-52]
MTVVKNLSIAMIFGAFSQFIYAGDAGARLASNSEGYEAETIKVVRTERTTDNCGVGVSKVTYQDRNGETHTKQFRILGSGPSGHSCN